MRARLGWCYNLALVALVFGCGAEGQGEDLSGTAQQAIQQLEAADAEAIRACEAKAEGCVAESNAEGAAICAGLENSCESLAERLAQVRAQAVDCWQGVADCRGDDCGPRADACRRLGEAVGEERQPVVECGNHVQQCMLQAAESGQHQMAELCGEMDAACGTGVADAAVECIQTRAQEISASSEASQTQEGDAEPSQEPAGAETQDQTQEGDGEPAAEPAGDPTQAAEAPTDAVQQRQQSCLEAVAACGESAGAGEADPQQLRDSGQACDLSACAG